MDDSFRYTHVERNRTVPDVPPSLAFRSQLFNPKGVYPHD